MGVEKNRGANSRQRVVATTETPFSLFPGETIASTSTAPPVRTPAFDSDKIGAAIAEQNRLLAMFAQIASTKTEPTDTKFDTVF